MQEEKSHNTILIINKLKKYLNLNTDLDLSKLLNVKPNTISTWKKRNSLDFNLIVVLCKKNNIDLNDLFFNKPSSDHFLIDNEYKTPLISREIQYKYCIGNFNLAELPFYNFPSIKNDHSRAFQVTSNNMLPLIEENSYVVCEYCNLDVLPDDSVVVVVSRDKGIFVNKLVKINGSEDMYLLKNENTFFKDFIIHADEINELWLIKFVMSFNFNNDFFIET